ncbi:MAG: hypothetical protein NTU81_01115 [Candidatus Nomurabacteria bacterium]|nr:hypothetical protein [Candidatus Nomurabacteria bacterium]
MQIKRCKCTNKNCDFTVKIRAWVPVLDKHVHLEEEDITLEKISDLGCTIIEMLDEKLCTNCNKYVLVERKTYVCPNCSSFHTLFADGYECPKCNQGQIKIISIIVCLTPYLQGLEL